LEIQQELQQYEHTGTVFGAINKKQFETLRTIDPSPEIVKHFRRIYRAHRSAHTGNCRGNTNAYSNPRPSPAETHVRRNPPPRSGKRHGGGRMNAKFTESHVEEAAIDWLEGLPS